MSDLHTVNEDYLLVKEKSPLILNIANYVSMDIVANSLLAVGASPVMSLCPEEIVEAVGSADAMCINIGTLDQQTIKTARIAAAAADQFKKKWVFDPAGAGFTSQRTRVAADLATNYSPSVIRCNPSEIIALASFIDKSLCIEGDTKGVDSRISSEEAIDYAMLVASGTGAVVAVSGSADYITDGDRVEIIPFGDPIMSKVTATGCSASAICAAFATVDQDTFKAVCNGLALFKMCGAKAAGHSNGPGSFRSAFIDELYNFKFEKYCPAEKPAPEE